MKKAEASKKVMELIQVWFKLKKDLKDTAGAYKEKIKDIESISICAKKCKNIFYLG